MHNYIISEYLYIKRQKKFEREHFESTYYHIAQLICDYLIRQNLTRADATAQNIADFHQLSSESAQSIRALLQSIYGNNFRKSGYGFNILGSLPIEKGGYHGTYPPRYSIELAP